MYDVAQLSSKNKIIITPLRIAIDIVIQKKCEISMPAIALNIKAPAIFSSSHNSGDVSEETPEEIADGD